MSEFMLERNEAARALRIHVASLDRMRKRGEGPPYIKAGKRRILYQTESVRLWAQRAESPATN